MITHSKKQRKNKNKQIKLTQKIFSKVPLAQVGEEIVQKAHAAKFGLAMSVTTANIAQVLVH